MDTARRWDTLRRIASSSHAGDQVSGQEESADGRTARVALVTGATAGMGAEIARQIAAAGLRVVVGGRSVEKADALAAEIRGHGARAWGLRLDITESASVASARTWIEENCGRLDVLVNNAGIALDQEKSPEAVTLEDWRRTFETNVFGASAVTNAMLPLLRQSEDGRIVNQSSHLGSHTLAARLEEPFVSRNWIVYNSSKAALSSMTLEYAKLLRATTVKVYATSPGHVSTGLNGKPGGLTAAEGAAFAVRLATQQEAAPNGTMWGPKGQVDW